MQKKAQMLGSCVEWKELTFSDRRYHLGGIEREVRSSTEVKNAIPKAYTAFTFVPMIIVSTASMACLENGCS